ncbi:MAG TPA: 4Fe-4S binding protein [Thermoguttaceae bacterium]|nr:4Fe-4S binding protein [Thermoguttaceae bacterium]
MAKRKIVEIDQSKCNGCGLCVPSCAEGAIQIIDGKAKLVADIYCDGLGACLGECPQDAITIIEREANPFDEEAAMQQVARMKATQAQDTTSAAASCPGSAHSGSSCPGSRAQSLPIAATGIPTGGHACGCETQDASAGEATSQLGNWPVQLQLVPPNAPFLQEADLLLVADCVPFALPDFHQRLLRHRPVVIGCPKLDDTNSYVEKLAAILTASNIKSLTVVHMEVPCCTGLLRIAEAARQVSGLKTPLEDVTVSIRGRIV